MRHTRDCRGMTSWRCSGLKTSTPAAISIPGSTRWHRISRAVYRYRRPTGFVCKSSPSPRGQPFSLRILRPSARSFVSPWRTRTTYERRYRRGTGARPLDSSGEPNVHSARTPGRRHHPELERPARHGAVSPLAPGGDIREHGDDCRRQWLGAVRRGGTAQVDLPGHAARKSYELGFFRGHQLGIPPALGGPADSHVLILEH